MHDLWFLIPVTYFRKIRTVGLSHTFLGIDKKDFLHTFMYRNLDRLICLTPRHRENLLSHLNISKDQLEIIPNMVDIDKFNPMHRSSYLRKKYSISNNKKIISLIGRLDPEKGQIETIQAIKMLKEKRQDFHVLIVGEDTKNNPGTKEILKNLITENKLEEFVTLAGFSTKVNRIMASSDLILVPSKAETFGRIIIEAMASGTPIIATNGGGVPDIITHKVDGLLVPNNKPESLYKGLLEALEQPELLKNVRKKALQKAHNKYSQQVVEKQLLSVLVAS